MSETLSNPSITLQVNGKSHTCPVPTGLLQLLAQLDLNPRLLAVEYNCIGSFGKAP
jgi:sulfur carrier protein